jgi:transcription elongation factor B subunit 1
VLEQVCKYFYYNQKYKDQWSMPELDIPPELCLELLMAADYLNSWWPFPDSEVTCLLIEIA